MKKENQSNQEAQDNKFDMLAAIPDVMTMAQYFECWGDIGYKLLNAIWPNTTEKPTKNFE